MKHILFILLSLLAGTLTAQDEPCPISFDEIDSFDSLRTVAAIPVSIGYLIPSRYELPDGPKLVEEAKVLMVFSEKDSISGFFMNVLIPEYGLQTVEQGMTVKLLLDDDSVIGFYTIPDEGIFDRTINMRVYQHTCAVPLDYYYKLAFHRIAKIRIEYKTQNRTVELSEEQQEALRESFQCIGRAVGLYPIQP